MADPASPAGSSPQMLTRKAVYECQTRIRHLDYDYVTREVSIAQVEGETPEATRARFEAAATALNGNYTGGCVRKTFSYFVHTAEELIAMRKAAEEAAAAARAAAAAPAIPDPCAGEWKNRPVCKG